MKKYFVHSNGEKVYIEGPKGCIARLCSFSAEFFENMTTIEKCSFRRFQEEAKNRGYDVDESHCPRWAA